MDVQATQTMTVNSSSSGAQAKAEGQPSIAEKNGTKSFSGILSSAQTALQVTGDVPPSQKAGRDAQLQWAAGQLESFFVQQLWTGMRKTLPEGGIFGESSFAMQTYEEMLDQERAKGMVQAGGLGLAKLVYDQMKGD